MSENIEQKILEEISKTGFPLELRVSELLNNRGYYVANNLYYVDLDEDKGREIDIRALKNCDFKIENERYYVRHCLLIECKKSSKKPWVIFSSPETSYDSEYFSVDCLGADFDTYSQEVGEAFDHLEDIHPFCRFKRRGRSFFEPFRDNQSGETTFRALMSTAKASIGMRNSEFGSGLNSICFFYPMVVFEGQLFEAYLNNSRVELNKTDSIIVSFFYESAKYKYESFAIPVVRENALEAFLNELDAVLGYWGSIAQKNRKLFKNAKSPTIEKDLGSALDSRKDGIVPSRKHGCFENAE
jgi:hypothetical protein